MSARRHPFCGSAAALALLLLTAGGCAALQAPADGDAGARENLHSTLWVQASAEYRAAALQAYDNARRALETALDDPTWTAATEQRDRAAYGDLPPAVVLDVDETVLDNSAYQARLILEDRVYSRESWDAWVEEARAAPVPGALAFTRYAAQRGVTVVYLTNRRHATEAATRRNLEAYGFPLVGAGDVVLTRGERPGWDTSDKEMRRRAVAERYRVLLLVGDNLGDFLPGVERTPGERAEMVEAHASYWGTRWILLPNPQYGSWEGALFDYDYGLTPAERLGRKRSWLDPAGTPPPQP